MISAREDGFDAVDLGGCVGGRDSGDFGDLGGVLAFEVEQHHLTVKRFQAMHECHDAFELDGAIGGVRGGQRAGVVERGPVVTDGSADVGRGGVVGDAVDPGFERAAVVE